MLKAFYYLHFALWRACRASKDPSFGEFRVQTLLLMIEGGFVSGLLLLVMERQVANLNVAVYVMATVTPLLTLNVYLFWNPKKSRKYETEFATYPLSRRRKLDALTAVISVGAIFLPVIAHVSK